MNDFDNETVLPCPFCGGAVTRYNGLGAIRCKGCLADGPYVPQGDARVARATAAWNQRWKLPSQSDKEQITDLFLTDPVSGDPCFIVSTLRPGPNGFHNFDIQSAPDATKWKVDVRISESLTQTRPEYPAAKATP